MQLPDNFTGHIVGLYAQNYKILSCVNIKPDGNIVEISGPNGNGKSTVLDSIWACLKNQSFNPSGPAKAPKAPIRKGERTGQVQCDFGEFIVKRNWAIVTDRETGEDSEITMRLVVEGKGGARYPSPQKLLDEFFSALSFDPLAFDRMPAKEKFELIGRTFLPDLDFAQIQALHDGDFATRADFNKFAKQERAAADLINVPPDTPAEEVDEDSLVEQLNTAHETNQRTVQRRQNRATAQEDIKYLRERPAVIARLLQESIQRAEEGTKKQIEQLEARILELREQITEAQGAIIAEREDLTAKANADAEKALKEAEELEAKLAAAEALPDLIDIEKVMKDIAEARKTNAAVRESHRRRAHLEKATTYEKQALELTQKMAARQAAKNIRIAQAKLPVPGLTFGDNALLLDGNAFEDGSTRQRTIASVAIGAAMNPKGRIMLIRGGNDIDRDGMLLMDEIAREMKMQFWIERIEPTTQTAVILENGHIKQPTTDSTGEPT